ncbi:hypothetical protein HS088_TW10G00241 [Tripterygium wilfordii]|uniref:Uncharacterized protein n=1 Tax=Tripterygium wilfordii TaxID=458696 RepID=A0A7J7D4H1_TRIWF|nr:hypothetical protein HS088_TW10G00241 [Tripterygium wilfordii]
MALQLRTNGGVTMLSGSGLVVPPSGGSDRRSQRMGGRQPHAQGRVMAVNGGDGGGVDGGKKKSVPNSNYVVPMDKSFSSPYTSVITRPLVEILRDLNKRIPDNIVKPPPTHHPSSSTFSIPCVFCFYLAFMTFPEFVQFSLFLISFPVPTGWCGEIRDVIFSDNGSVTVVYRVTIRGSDGEVVLFLPMLSVVLDCLQ